MGRIVHTKGSIGRRGVAQGAICRTCPGGCKTDCLRAGVNNELTHRAEDFDFSIYFKEIEPSSSETGDYSDPFDDF